MMNDIQNRPGCACMAWKNCPSQNCVECNSKQVRTCRECYEDTKKRLQSEGELTINLSSWTKTAEKLPEFSYFVLVLWESAGTIGLDYAKFEDEHWINKHGMYCEKDKIKYWCIPPYILKYGEEE